MTLTSLNTRYVKLITKMAVMSAGLLLIVVSLLSPTYLGVEASGFKRHPAEAENSIPPLQGAAAITDLKKRKLYESLRAALNGAGARRSDYSVVTPLFVNEQKLTASDGAAFDEFGNSVAFSGSTMVVGAPDGIDGNPDQGSAYVFNRQGGAWAEAQKLTASDGAADNFFGWSVAVSDSTIVVGAWPDDIGGNGDQGSAYVFNRLGNSWIETDKLTASDGEAGDHFGWSVAVSGSTIIVGALSDKIGDNFFQGSAYVFNRQGESWVETQKLTGSDGRRFDQFGWSVAVSDSTVVVGATRSLFQGSAHVFNRQGGSWVEEQKLIASDGETFDEFGWSVAVSGSTVVVSAISTNHFELQGSAYVFNRRGKRWVEEQKLNASDTAEFDEFGYSVAISDSTIVVSAPGDDAADGSPAQGAAYIFNRQGGEWIETQKLTASDGGAGDFFGKSVAVNGSTVVVSALNDTIGSNFFQGSTYVFNRHR